MDTSAMVKLLVEEPETIALRRRLASLPKRASAALLRVELIRTVRRAGMPRLVGDAKRLLASISLIGLDDELLDRAASLEPLTLRSLDAIHLAAAIGLGDDLAALLTYDDRMTEAAHAVGIPLLAPR